MQCILYKIYFWKFFYMYYNLICILYALLCGQKFNSCEKWVLQLHWWLMRILHGGRLRVEPKRGLEVRRRKTRMRRKPRVPPTLPLTLEFLTASSTSTPSPSSHALFEYLEEGFLLTFAPDIACEAQLLQILTPNITIMYKDEVFHLEHLLLLEISVNPEVG
jgi:hypothetical protein